MEVTILLFSPLRIIFFQHSRPYEFFITTILQIKNRESCCYSTFDSFWMVVGWQGSLCPWIEALNPEELCNSSGRIQHSIEITPGNKKTKDMIYLKSTKAAEAAEAAEQAKYLESQRESEEPF